MGAINDRTQEHLGTTDAMIIRTRRRLIDAARALREHGTVPPGVDQPELYRTRTGGVVLPRSADWLRGHGFMRGAIVLLRRWSFLRTHSHAFWFPQTEGEGFECLRQV